MVDTHAIATYGCATISSAAAMARLLWPRSSTLASTQSEMQYENRRVLAVPALALPWRPVAHSSQESSLLVSSHENSLVEPQLAWWLQQRPCRHLPRAQQERTKDQCPASAVRWSWAMAAAQR
jgi:hypothetical protein